MRISVITPTKGERLDSLGRLCRVLAKTLNPIDEHIIVYDRCAKMRLPDHGEHGLILLRRDSRDSVFGNIQRDWGIMHATGDCIVFCDDDDIVRREGIEKLHSLDPNPRYCDLFRMSTKDGVFETNDISEGKIAGPQIVVPNVDNLPKWADYNEYTADFQFIRNSLARFKRRHHDEVLCEVRPDGLPEDLL